MLKNLIFIILLTLLIFMAWSGGLGVVLEEKEVSAFAGEISGEQLMQFFQDGLMQNDFSRTESLQILSAVTNELDINLQVDAFSDITENLSPQAITDILNNNLLSQLTSTTQVQGLLSDMVAEVDLNLDFINQLDSRLSLNFETLISSEGLSSIINQVGSLEQFQNILDITAGDFLATDYLTDQLGSIMPDIVSEIGLNDVFLDNLTSLDFIDLDEIVSLEQLNEVIGGLDDFPQLQEVLDLTGGFLAEDFLVGQFADILPDMLDNININLDFLDQLDSLDFLNIDFNTLMDIGGLESILGDITGLGQLQDIFTLTGGFLDGDLLGNILSGFDGDILGNIINQAGGLLDINGLQDVLLGGVLDNIADLPLGSIDNIIDSLPMDIQGDLLSSVPGLELGLPTGIGIPGSFSFNLPFGGLVISIINCQNARLLVILKSAASNLPSMVIFRPGSSTLYEFYNLSVGSQVLGTWQGIDVCKISSTVYIPAPRIKMVGTSEGDLTYRPIEPPPVIREPREYDDRDPCSDKDPDSVDWDDFSSKLSKYYTLGDMTKNSRNRLPNTSDMHDRTDIDEVKRNMIEITCELDKIREAWGHRIGITSGYRPPTVNSIYSTASDSRHLYGHAVDIANEGGGSRCDFQEWLDCEYDWPYALGYGAKTEGGLGFVHIDLRPDPRPHRFRYTTIPAEDRCPRSTCRVGF